MTGSAAARKHGLVGMIGFFCAIALVAAEAKEHKGSNVAMHCRTHHSFGGSWNPAKPLISSGAQVGDVLSQRDAGFMTSHGHMSYGIEVSRYELIIAARWTESVGVNPEGRAATNVPGIALVISGGGYVLKPTLNPVVIAIHSINPDPGAGPTAVSTSLLKQLVLTVPPEKLPVGPESIVVTGFGGGVALTLYAINVPQGLYKVGQEIREIPWYPVNTGICAGSNEPPFVGTGAMALGHGGGNVEFSNACEVGLTQTKEVLMGMHSLRDFPSLGATSEARPFDITLGKCSALARPKISFKATNGTSQDGTVLNLASSSDAQGQQAARGFGIIMIDETTNQRVEFGKAYNMAPIEGDGAQMRLRASYLRTAPQAADMSGGHANGTAEFTIDFP